MAGVVQWQNGSFPSFIRGFDSLRPLRYLVPRHEFLDKRHDFRTANISKVAVNMRWRLYAQATPCAFAYTTTFLVVEL